MPPEVRILPKSGDGTEEALEELRRLLTQSVRPLVSFATGATYAAMFGRIAEEIEDVDWDPRGYTATHPDEYVGYGVDREGGMAHELFALCPPLKEALKRGAFFPVPGEDDRDALAAHEERLTRAGGVALQFLGLGRNGHVAFNEPGSSVDRGFARIRLAQTTRADAQARFAPADPPEEAITAGLGELLASRRIILMATGAAKAEAVRGMLEGEVGSHCPASFLRQHENVLVLLDRESASLLRTSPFEELDHQENP